MPISSPAAWNIASRLSMSANCVCTCAFTCVFVCVCGALSDTNRPKSSHAIHAKPLTGSDSGTTGMLCCTRLPPTSGHFSSPVRRLPQLKQFECTLEEQRLLVYGMFRQKKFTLDEHEANDTRKECQLRHHARHMELVVDECTEGGSKNPTRERSVNFLQMARHLDFK